MGPRPPCCHATHCSTLEASRLSGGKENLCSLSHLRTRYARIAAPSKTPKPPASWSTMQGMRPFGEKRRNQGSFCVSFMMLTDCQV